MKKLKTQAFTLVELIVVITILAILWTIAFISFQNYTSNARDWVRVADLNSIKKNLELFITEKWFYPTPDNVTNITYSWAVAWSQWTVWNNVITNLARLNKKPTDPLTNSEYTYSITNTKTEYQLSSISEWWLSYYIPLTNQANAATSKTATAKVTWSYNEKLLKVSTGWIDYILAVPSIIDADLTDSNLQNIINNRKLVYNNYQNLPDSYKNTWYTMTWWFNFNPPSNDIVVYSWSLSNLLNSWIVQQQFVIKLQTAYNWTIIQSEPTIKEILFATNATQQQTLVWNYITNHVWWITWINTVVTQTQTYSCSWSLVTANAIITNTWWLTTDTNYQTTNSGWLCYYTCINSYTWSNCNEILDPNMLTLGNIKLYKINWKTQARVDWSNLIIWNSDAPNMAVSNPLLWTDLISWNFSLSFNVSAFWASEWFLWFTLINQSYSWVLAEYATYNGWAIARKFYSAYAYTSVSWSNLSFQITRNNNIVTACVSWYCSNWYTVSWDVKIGLYYSCRIWAPCYNVEKTLSNIVFIN
jgi:prepilin-type N-terminal cleavage/methylation domain-containing protein